VIADDLDLRRRPRGVMSKHPTRLELARFFSRVTVDENGCWIWSGALSNSGYGVHCWRTKVTSAHRVSYRWYSKGQVRGLDVDHLCRVRRCVNPVHLQAVTHKVNVRRTNRRAS
jgi:hypothetical protein